MAVLACGAPFARREDVDEVRVVIGALFSAVHGDAADVAKNLAHSGPWCDFLRAGDTLVRPDSYRLDLIDMAYSMGVR